MHPYCSFSLRCQMTPRQIAKFRTTPFRQFRSSLRKDSVANYSSIWTQFQPSVKRLDVLSFSKLLIVPSVGGATGNANLR